MQGKLYGCSWILNPPIPFAKGGFRGVRIMAAGVLIAVGFTSGIFMRFIKPRRARRARRYYRIIVFLRALRG